MSPYPFPTMITITPRAPLNIRNLTVQGRGKKAKDADEYGGEIEITNLILAAAFCETKEDEESFEDLNMEYKQ